MKRLLFSILLLAICGVSNADTPPARSINSFTYDGTGTNAISSTLFGGVKALDMNVANTTAQPAYFSLVFSGSVIDPRAIRLLTASDIVTAQQGGAWNVGITGSLPLPTGAATETTLDAINNKITTTVDGIKVDIGASVLSGSVFSKTQDGAGTSITSTLNGGKQSLDVHVSGSALPTGASTEATLSALNTKVVTTANGIKVDGSAVTQPVSVSSLPLPSGAATEATLATINGKFNTLGQKAAAGSVPVVIASDQSSIPTSNSNIDVLLSTRATEATLNSRATETTLSALNTKIKAFDLDTGAGADNVQGVNLRFAANGGSVQAGTSTNPIRIDPIGITVQPINGTVTANIGTLGGAATESTLSLINGKLNSLGQKTAANSVPVVLASDDTVDVTQSGTWNINNITGTVPLPTGAATSALQTTINTTLQASQPRKLQDGNGNIVTSQASGSQRALDVGINVSGVQVDPRAIRTLTSGSDSIVAVQGGAWTISANNDSVQSTGTATPIKATFVGGTDGTNLRGIKVSSTGVVAVDGSAVTQPVSAASLPLPTGASTSALQTTLNGHVDGIEALLTTIEANQLPNNHQVTVSNASIAVTGPLTDTQLRASAVPVSVGSLPLPAGASTSALQTTGNNLLTTIDNSVNAMNAKFNSLGQKNMAGSVPVVLASDQSDAPFRLKDKDGNGITSTTALGKQAIDVFAVGITSASVVDHDVSGTLTAACASGSGCAAGSTITLDINGVSSGIVDINGTWAGTIVVDGSNDNFATFRNVSLWTPPDGLITTGVTANGLFRTAAIAGFEKVRVRASALTSGTVSIGLRASVGVATVVPLSPNPTSNKAQIYGSSSSLPIQQDGSGNLLAAQTGTWNIQDITGIIALPTGAATAAHQVTQNGHLSNIVTATQSLDTDFDVALSTRASESTLSTLNGKIPANLTVTSTRLLVDGSGVTQPISAAALPLPAGAATSANQTTANGSLASIDTDFDVALSTRASESTLSALSAKFNSLGQKTMANSAPIVIASDQSAIPVSQSGTWNINNITGTISLPTGAATSANQATQITSLQLIDDSIHSMNAAFDKGVAFSGQMDDASVTQATENNVAPVRITADRALHVNLRTNGSEAGTTANPLKVDGNVAAAATDAGNPVKIGGVFNTTQPTLTNGQRGNVQLSSRGAVIVSGSAAVGAAPIDNPVSVSGVDGSGNKRHIRTDTAGSQLVVGDIASGSADSGAPVKVGGRFNSTAPALTDGQRGDLQLDQSGNLLIAQRNVSAFINTATTTTVKSGAGLLSSFCYTTPANGTSITIYNNTTGTGTVLFTYTPPNGIAPQCLNLDLRFTTGLTVVTNTTAGVLVVYQ